VTLPVLETLFDSPWYLALLALLPAVWWLGWGSLSGLGPIRSWMVLAVRSAVVVVLVLALAEVQFPRTSDKLSVIYLLDQSESIPANRRRAMFDYVVREVSAHRDAGRGDRAGVIVFGREAAVDTPPLDAAPSRLGAIDSLPLIRGDATNLAAALKLAQATFPEDSARRVVLISDGNQNLGDARGAARLMADAGTGIDVVPVRLAAQSETMIEKVSLPSDIQRGQTFEARVVLDVQPGANATATRVPGRLRLSRLAGQREELLDEAPVVLEPGKNVFRFPHQIDEPGAYTYKARFVPDRPGDDLFVQNNEATAFTHVRGRGRVLLIESYEHQGDFDRLITGLRTQNLEVDVTSSDQLFTSLAELQAYDVVILANVPRTGGSDQQRGAGFSDQQIAMLVRNTEQLGGGLVMLGGPEGFGAGGWTGTELEKVMPVDFQIKNSKVVPIGALMLVLDKSGSMSGQKIALSRAAAAAAIKVLSPKDYIGVVTFDSAAYSTVPLRRVEDSAGAVAAIRRIGADGGTDMYPGMQQGYAALQRSPAANKHMVVLTDGQTPDADFERLARRMRADKITISAIAVGDDAQVSLLARIAHEGGGKFYHVRDPRAIPRIFIQEALRVARPLVFERPEGMAPRMETQHEMLQGIEGPLPPITGYVLTSLKDNPLVDAPLVSPLPADAKHSTLLAGWNFGLGRSVAFTSDAGHRWASDWTGWPDYDKFFAQLVRWAMRPSVEGGKFTAAVDQQDGRVRLIVTALDASDEFLNFLDLSAAVVDPEMNSHGVTMQQIAPGRYVGECAAPLPGSYFATVVPSGGTAPILLGISVPHSAEFRELETNTTLLQSLAAFEPQGGEPGTVIDVAWDSPAGVEGAPLGIDTFRRTLPSAVSVEQLWPLLLVVAACAFFADVLVRRVTVDLSWLGAGLLALQRFVLRRDAPAAPDQRIERLRSRKQEVAQSLEQQRAAARFEPSADAPPAADVAARFAAPPDAGHCDAAAESTLTPEAVEDDYTTRLLKTKQRIRRQHRPE
jgi:Mg-chelatase subunit ChlD